MYWYTARNIDSNTGEEIKLSDVVKDQRSGFLRGWHADGQAALQRRAGSVCQGLLCQRRLTKSLFRSYNNKMKMVRLQCLTIFQK